MKMSYTNYQEKKEIRDLFSNTQKSLSEQMRLHQEDPEAELFCGDVYLESMNMNPGTKPDDIRLTFLLPIFAVRSTMIEKKIEADEILEALFDRFTTLWDEDETGIHLTPMVESGDNAESLELETLDRRRTKMVDKILVLGAPIKRGGNDATAFCGLIEFDGILSMKNVDRFTSFARHLPSMILKTLAYGEEFFYGIEPIVKRFRPEDELVFPFPPYAEENDAIDDETMVDPYDETDGEDLGEECENDDGERLFSEIIEGPEESDRPNPFVIDLTIDGEEETDETDTTTHE